VKAAIAVKPRQLGSWQTTAVDYRTRRSWTSMWRQETLF